MKATLKIGQFNVEIEAARIEEYFKSEDNTYEFLNTLATYLNDAYLYNRHGGYPTLAEECRIMEDNIELFLQDEGYYNRCDI